MKIAQPDSIVEEVSAEVTAFLAAPKALIAGKSHGAASGETYPVYNPATGGVLTHVPACGAVDIDLAVTAAQAAFEGPWSKMLPVQRQGLLLRLADLIEAHGEELAQLETLNQGKSIMLSRLIEVQSSAEYFRYMAGWATKIEGSTLDVSIPIPPGMSYQAFTRKEPVGVVAAITPWNFPLNMASWKVAPALAAGCTVVLKPAEETPLTSIRLAELCLEAGFPEGVVNVVTGMGETAGAALVSHPGVAKITFTGSTETGKLIGIQAMKDMKRVTLELGGKAPMVMFDDMDLDLLGAAAGIGSFFNTGQTCCAGVRIYAQKGIYDKALEVIANVTRSLAIGSGLDPRNQINPVVSARHQAHVKACIARGLEDGAKPVIGAEAPAEGFFVAPELFIDVRQDMALMQDEVFGPVITMTPFSDPDEAIAMANDTRYGLGASIWTNDLNKMMRYVPKIQAGTVWVNSHNIPDQNMPFGGVKQSGIGREHGRGALDNYLETKSVCVAYR
ncbi:MULTISPECIES: aldehyde dehydrogenase family protein [Alphaproteobacteria]|uniref:Aldehyde dehydrogenase n=2 Tax=Alphaproteobacteria TaxID=28211 RepID=A0A512HH12_9HYPH|nr:MULTISPECIES: aldehyde dehydrogenase family protein [Alphaproteobacteria]GEO84743.1 aldehyde dehydrogenase [Ciceribacter naphthalenivorans]GLR20636.1 aldehyde dehydrogenase [Ciceribacter naphthalenivorans]GLT03492.1 aldehyde dehydrogenase [Sphingomonas psychrolutea]